MDISKLSRFNYKNIFQKIIHNEILKLNILNFKIDNKNNNFKIWKDNHNEQLYDTISYFIIVKVTKSNVICNILSTDGKVLINITSGKLGLKGPNKSKKFSIISMLKDIIYNYDFIKNQPIAVKFEGLKYNNKLILKKFNEKFILKAVVYENRIPHNGCRPRKLKRK